MELASEESCCVFFLFGLGCLGISLFASFLHFTNRSHMDNRWTLAVVLVLVDVVVMVLLVTVVGG